MDEYLKQVQWLHHIGWIIANITNFIDILVTIYLKADFHKTNNSIFCIDREIRSYVFHNNNTSKCNLPIFLDIYRFLSYSTMKSVSIINIFYRDIFPAILV